MQGKSREEHREVLKRFACLEERLEAVEGKLDRVLRSLTAIKGNLMALSQDLKDLAAKMDAATNDIAALITKLAAGIKNSMTDAEVAEVKASFGTLSDRLTSLGKDPVDPVPPEPPPLITLKKK